MKPEDFNNCWSGSNHRIIKPGAEELSKFDFKPHTLEFLRNIGLPDCFGELNFHYEEEPLESVKDKWNLGEEHFSQYVEIGSNGSGDPVVIKLVENDALVCLDPENDFQEIFINSDIYKFASSILRMDQFYRQFKKLSPTSTFSTEFSDEEYQNLVNDLKQIDSRIFEQNDSYWRMMISSLLGEREQERRKK